MFDFTEEQSKRYARHIILPHIGGEGQRKLLDSRVLIIGAGGLGAPASLYLAAAGVGTLGVVDFDVVDLSNLQRQIIHSNDDIGRPKVDSAARRLRTINPDVNVIKHAVRFTAKNAAELVRDYDLVVECSDNFASKYLANDICVRLGKPLVWGAVFQFDGQLSVVRPGQSACYRCIFPSPPPAGSVPTCAQAGILGALVGVIGCWQALEAIKVLTGAGQSLHDRLLIFDGLASESEVVHIARRPECAVCGETPTITNVATIDYDAFCCGGRIVDGIQPA